MKDRAKPSDNHYRQKAERNALKSEEPNALKGPTAAQDILYSKWLEFVFFSGEISGNKFDRKLGARPSFMDQSGRDIVLSCPQKF